MTTSPARPTPSLRARAGTTLIELLVVVIIVAITAGLASMAIGESGTAHVEMAEIQVRTLVERAQALARSNRMAHGVVFDVAGNRVAIVDETGALAVDPLTRREYVLDFSAPNQPQQVDVQGASFGATGSAIVFDPQGVPLAGGSVTVGRGKNIRVITVDGATGRVASS